MGFYCPKCDKAQTSVTAESVMPVSYNNIEITLIKCGKCQFVLGVIDTKTVEKVVRTELNALCQSLIKKRT